MVKFQDGVLKIEGYVEVNGSRIKVHMPKYVGNTPLSAENLNKLQNDLQMQINSLASGSPLVASSIEEMIDTERVYVNTTDGKWYYYNGITWEIGGVYQATGISERDPIIAEIINGINEIANHVETVDLLDGINPTVGYSYTADATTKDNYIADNGGGIYPLINIEKGQVYTYEGIRPTFTSVLYEDGTRLVFANINNGDNNGKFTATDNGILFLTVRASQIGTTKFYNGDSDKPINEYYPNLLKIRKSDIKSDNEIHVKRDGTGDFTSLVEAIRSIQNSSKNNVYDVYIYDDHDILEELGGESYYNSITVENGRSGLIIPEYVNLYGVDRKVVLSCEVNSAWGYNYAGVTSISGLEIYKGNNILKNIEVVVRNCRYAIHDEMSGANPNSFREIENCTFIHKGNRNFSNQTNQWLSVSAYGMGTASGQIGKWKNCIFKSDAFRSYLCHDNADFAVGANLQFDNCEFINEGNNETYNESVRFSSYGSGTIINVARLNNCILSKINIANEGGTASQNRWRVVGGGNRKEAIIEADISIPTTIDIE